LPMIRTTDLYTANKTLKFIHRAVNVKPFQVVWRGFVVAGTWNSVTRAMENRPIWLHPDDVKDLEIFLDGVDKR